MFESIGRSFELLGECFEVIKKDKELLFFPLISGFLTLILFITFLIPLILTQLAKDINNAFGLAAMVTLFLFYFLSYFIVIFFNAGLMAAAKIRLSGGDPKFSDGMKAAISNLPKILLWALIAATVGIVLRNLQERSGWLGRLIIGLLGMAWSILTFFVVPVIVLEKGSVFEAISRSGSLVKKTWGEQVVGALSLGAAFVILFLLGLAALIGSIFLGIKVFLVMLVLVIGYWCVLGILNASLSGIYATALYLYATTGKVPSAFKSDAIKHAFRHR